MTSAQPSNAFELLLSALQSEAGFTPEQCAIVRTGLDQWGAMVRLLAGGEPVPLPAYAGPCRVHRFPLVADDDSEPYFQGTQGANVRWPTPMASGSASRRVTV